jgi:hypothetical protein
MPRRIGSPPLDVVTAQVCSGCSAQSKPDPWIGLKPNALRAFDGKNGAFAYIVSATVSKLQANPCPKPTPKQPTRCSLVLSRGLTNLLCFPITANVKVVCNDCRGWTWGSTVGGNFKPSGLRPGRSGKSLRDQADHDIMLQLRT